jgi:hypothetical protein
MSYVLVLVLIVVGALVTLTGVPGAEILQGIGTFWLPDQMAGWDFSEQCAVDWYVSDLVIADIIDPPLGWTMTAFTGGLITMITDTTFEELATAPEDTTIYTYELHVYVDVVYVIRTPEHHYAKFRVIGVSLPTIEYAYQSDGSTNLKDVPTGIPDEITTWGQVKALYVNEE